MMNRFWLSYDLGLQGDYEPLYASLDAKSRRELWRFGRDVQIQCDPGARSARKSRIVTEHDGSGCI